MPGSPCMSGASNGSGSKDESGASDVSTDRYGTVDAQCAPVSPGQCAYPMTVFQS
jgi:hypothetical protein